jgi:hypothetical protein
LIFLSVGIIQLEIVKWYSYVTFEQGHGLAFLSKDSNFYVDGQIEARRVFGTPEENQYSVVTAIRRNPQAYLQRIPQLIKLIPTHGVNVYGGGLAIFLILLAAKGMVEL